VEPAQNAKPGPPCLVENTGRPAPSHFISAAILTLLVAGIYGRIGWGMFAGSEDYRLHVDFARSFYESGHPPVPHFLFHALTAALFVAHIAPNLVRAGRFVVVGCYVVIPVLTYALLWLIFKGSRWNRPWVLFCAGLVTLLAQPITLAHAYAIGYFWPETYQIPTATLLKPFALLGFACTAWCLSRSGVTSRRFVVLFAIVTVAGALSKPSFAICVVPAAALVAAYRLVRRLPVSVRALVWGLYGPTIVVLGWQFYVTHGAYATGQYHDSIEWAPLRFMSYWATGLLGKFLLTIAFPLTVTLLYWREARGDAVLQLAWSCFLFGAFDSYMLAERIHWSAGNLTWSGNITAYLLLAVSVVFWLRMISEAPSGRWLRQRTTVCGLVLVLHVASGARLDWTYLSHYGCPIDYRHAELVCPTSR
jgi:hypothetical protein